MGRIPHPFRSGDLCQDKRFRKTRLGKQENRKKELNHPGGVKRVKGVSKESPVSQKGI